jgi:hypothetical protein
MQNEFQDKLDQLAINNDIAPINAGSINPRANRYTIGGLIVPVAYFLVLLATKPDKSLLVDWDVLFNLFFRYAGFFSSFLVFLFPLIYFRDRKYLGYKSKFLVITYFINGLFCFVFPVVALLFAIGTLNAIGGFGSDLIIVLVPLLILVALLIIWIANLWSLYRHREFRMLEIVLGMLLLVASLPLFLGGLSSLIFNSRFIFGS